MSQNIRKYKWTVSAPSTWAIKAHRGYTATIAYNGNGLYTLTVNPGAIASTYPSLKLAKNGYRLFLHTKSA